jgi:WD40 repeat protein
MRYVRMFFLVAVLWIGLFAPVQRSHAQQAMPPAQVRYVVWSPDGTRLASGDASGVVSIWDPITGERLLKFQAQSGTITSLAWSPDSTRLASAGVMDKNARIWNIDNGALVAELQADSYYDNEPISVAWNSDGTKIANATFEPDGGFPLRFWNVQGDHYELMSSSPDVSAFNIAWRPNSTSLALADYRGIYILDKFSFDYFQQHTVLDLRMSIAWDHDGSKLAAAIGVGYANGSVEATGEINTIDPATGKILTTFQNVTSDPHTIGIGSMAWDVDDATLFTDGFDGNVRIWNTVKGELVDTLSLGRKNGRSLMSLSPDGGRLALGNYTPASDISTEQDARENVIQTFDDGAIQIVVPLPSLSRLQTIAAACHAPAQVLDILPQSETADQLTTFIYQIGALPQNTISSGCSADLIAVADALQS